MKPRVANVESHIQSAINVEGKIQNQQLSVLKLLKMKSSEGQILKILIWVLRMKSRMTVLFRRRGIMH